MLGLQDSLAARAVLPLSTPTAHSLQRKPATTQDIALQQHQTSAPPPRCQGPSESVNDRFPTGAILRQTSTLQKGPFYGGPARFECTLYSTDFRREPFCVPRRVPMRVRSRPRATWCAAGPGPHAVLVHKAGARDQRDSGVT